ncbi:RlmE family RNA methyltransferase [Desulfobacterales bacterium HSG17]|nr:RlmE family RNA methyltransferase [Desulfobacterales bacterium HSG17]
MPKPKNKKKQKPDIWADHYTEKAKAMNYPARSVFKLEEIQNKFAILKKGQSILDLGCAPGSWLLLTAKIIGPKGRVAGVDLNPLTIQLPPQALFFEADATEADAPFWSELAQFDCVLSDMAPNTTGNRSTDVIRSLALAETALWIATQRLKPGGNFICKVFMGAGIDEFLTDVKKMFQTCKTFKPQSTRKASMEIFVIAKNKKQEG